MKNSIKKSILILTIAIVVIVYITTIMLFMDFQDLNQIFNIKSILTLILFILFFSIPAVIIARLITYPLKKIEKNMRLVARGKMVETKHLKEISKFAEINDTIEAFDLMMELIRKNNFDLNSQQSKTEIILEHMADGVVAFSVTKQTIHMNKSAQRLLNLDVADDTFEKVVNKLNIELEFDQVMYLPTNQSLQSKMKVGENSLNIIFVPFFSDKLIPMGVIMIARDITETVRLENQRKEFVANVSHELKTPLTSIKGYSETMMTGDLTFQEITRFSKVINQEANRMGRIVTDLLQLSRLDDKKFNMKKTTFSLDELIKNVCEKMTFSAKEKNHKLECFVTVEPPAVYADKDSVEQIIVNIISNSIKYTPEGGLIRVYVGSVEKNAYFKVIDNGIGIPEKDLDRIFERFYRVDKARSRKMGGTGLGLSIVKELVDVNNGTIDIKSEVNKGTEVIVTLPTKIK